MIAINTSKGLVRVESWDDVLARVGFSDDLNPKEHELGAIIGRYIFGDKVRCGLSDCHTPHTRGYLVATKDGRETNIGKDCGSKYFGVDFEDQARQFERDLAAADNRELLWTVYFRLVELEEKIALLRVGNDGANWVNRNCNALMNPAKVPVEITRKLAEFIKAKSGILTSQRRATQAEIESLEVMQGRSLPRPHYVDEKIAEIRGIEALYPENSLPKLLVIHLEENIKAFKAKDIDTLPPGDLTHWSKWSQTIEGTLDTAMQSIAHGRILLTRPNLKPLLDIGGFARPDDSDRFKAFLATLPA